MLSRRLKKISKKSPEIAVIGGGIFGATAALILGKRFSVTLFEKNLDILGEATWANQYRHHYGFHYPRSIVTINEIKRARKDFERFYKSIIVSAPSYYCVSKTGSKVSPGKYLGIFKRLRIPYKLEYPPRKFLNRSAVGVCIRTPEAVYDYKRLKHFIVQKIRSSRNIRLKLKHEIVGAKIGNDGEKILKIKSKEHIFKQNFDYVINATYARHNNFCSWLGFPEKSLRFRLKELPLLKLSTKQRCAVTIMDGPFATILPAGNSLGVYTLGDVPLSVHRSAKNIKNAAVEDRRWGKITPRYKEMQKRCAKWFPIVRDAKRLDSMFVILPAETDSEKNDARPTSITRHDHGCWSVFSGKIVTCVSAAEEILKELEKDHESR